MKNLLKLFCIVSLVLFFSCSSESEEVVKPKPITSVEQVGKAKNSENGRLESSNPAVIAYFVDNGYTVDPNDDQHYSYYMGGTGDVTIHLRADPTFDDKYTVTYTGTGHVGERLVYEGYIPSGGFAGNLLNDYLKVGLLL